MSNKNISKENKIEFLFQRLITYHHRLKQLNIKFLKTSAYEETILNKYFQSRTVLIKSINGVEKNIESNLQRYKYNIEHILKIEKRLCKYKKDLIFLDNKIIEKVQTYMLDLGVNLKRMQNIEKYLSAL